jgi:class 3 adenylate cyclase
MPAERACAWCGAESLQGGRFCHLCGRPIDRTDNRAEYKQVTVLFADVVHSMDLAAAVGAERLREIMVALVDCAAAVVRRYQGRLDKFTGDGIMALFGAPVALEDHAERACRAALEIHRGIGDIAREVSERDGVSLALRIGLNSGQVIAGEIGSSATGYTAVGEQVGMAQRMESVAPAGGVMLSASTARLVEGVAVLAAAELVHIKGSAHPVHARQLKGISEREHAAVGEVSKLVGRRWEMAAVEGLLTQAVDGQGAVLAVAGSPGIGKSRLVREITALAADQGVEVFGTYCESHTNDIAFHVVARLLRAVTKVRGMDASAARARIRSRTPEMDPEDRLLFEDLLGIAEPEIALPKIDPDARRRRLSALVNAWLVNRESPAIFAVEDVHWIDEASESMLAEFFMVIPQTPSLVLVTYRPEYSGALSRVSGAQGIALAPLSRSESTRLVADLVGADPSVSDVAYLVAERAAGNPFFAQEMVRDLAERGVLGGSRGAYTSTTPSTDISVPATLQAAIAARIDRLTPAAKRTLCAAAVIGSRFSERILETLGIDPAPQDLVTGAFVDRITFNANPEYVFHHPLIRTVAYESQLKSDRAELHRRVAAAIEAQGSPDKDAALIAEHLEAAQDLPAAYGWHMRSASWATNRDITAARASWERAREIADRLPQLTPDGLAARIAPRTMLCGTAFRANAHVSDSQFEELRRLCHAAGDKSSLAIAMIGLVVDRAFQAQIREASQLASEAMALVESVGDPTLTAGLSFAAIYAEMENAQWSGVLRWSQMVVDAADGDPSMGNFIIGSPLAAALTSRAVASYCLGRPGWLEDLQHALAMARSVDPLSHARAVTYCYTLGIPNGVLSPVDSALREIDDALRSAERSGDDHAVALARMTLGLALVHRSTDAERHRGEQILTEFLQRGHNKGELPVANVFLAREKARRGEPDEALLLMHGAVDDLTRQGQLLGWGMVATGVLVETLLDGPSGATGDKLAQARAAIDRLATAAINGDSVIRDTWLVRLRALLARATGDGRYRDLRDRYTEIATTHGFQGHTAWAQAMP